MINKRTYKETLVSIETHMIYIQTHLKNIDSHMAKINDTNLEQEVKLARNKDRISLGYKLGGRIGGGLFAVLLLAIGVILKLAGIY